MAHRERRIFYHAVIHEPIRSAGAKLGIIITDDLRIIPPADYTWAESRQVSGVGRWHTTCLWRSLR